MEPRRICTLIRLLMTEKTTPSEIGYDFPFDSVDPIEKIQDVVGKNLNFF